MQESASSLRRLREELPLLLPLLLPPPAAEALPRARPSSCCAVCSGCCPVSVRSQAAPHSRSVAAASSSMPCILARCKCGACGTGVAVMAKTATADAMVDCFELFSHDSVARAAPLSLLHQACT